MKTYRLQNRITREFQDVRAESAQEACNQVGWAIGDTWVREQTEGRYTPGWSNITQIGQPQKRKGGENE